MRKTFPALSILICLGSLLFCSDAHARIQLPRTSDQVVSPDRAAVAASNAWLAIVDSGSYTKSFQELPRRIQAGGETAEKGFVSWLRSRRAPLGDVVSRRVVRARFSHTMAGGPDGNYEFLDYETTFTRKTSALEIVTLTTESGHWQVSGYKIR
jgi:Protein of unknown function (DUF4019)